MLTIIIMALQKAIGLVMGGINLETGGMTNEDNNY